MKMPVYCWHCGRRFYIELDNYYAGKLFCGDKCRIDNLKKEIELEKKKSRHQVLLNNCIDDDRVILHEREIKNLRREGID